MSEINNNSNATGGSAKVVVTGQGEAAQKENLLQALLSFAMDIPRTVRTSATVGKYCAMSYASTSIGFIMDSIKAISSSSKLYLA